jgi:hypothetical protein
MPRRHGKFMRVKLYAFVTSALSRKSTVSFTLQPLRIRRKASLPTRRMIGSDAETINIFLPGRQPWPSSRYLFWMSEQFSISSHLWMRKLYIWKNTKCLKTDTFVLRRDVTFRLVIVKETKKVFKLLLLKSKTCWGVKFSTKRNTSFRLEVELQAQNSAVSIPVACSRQAVWSGIGLTRYFQLCWTRHAKPASMNLPFFVHCVLSPW